MSKQQTVQSEKNPMLNIKLEKVVLSCGAMGPDLDKSKKLLEILTKRKAQIIHAGPKRRIPNFGVKPNVALGTSVTVRRQEAVELLKRVLAAIDNEIKFKQITHNSFSFGIREYIEIPGIEYQRDIGIRGLNVTATFIRPGARVKKKKIKTGRVPQRHNVTPEEIKNYMEEHFDTEVL